MAEVAKTLIIENDQELRSKYAAILEFVGHGKTLEADCGSCFDRIKDDDVTVILLSSCGDQETLVQTFDQIKETSPDIPVILLLSREDKQQPSAEMLQQVFCVIYLPLNYPELTDALHRAQVFREGKQKKRNGFNLDLFRSLVGNSRGIRQVRQLIEQVADSEATVLILLAISSRVSFNAS